MSFVQGTDGGPCIATFLMREGSGMLLKLENGRPALSGGSSSKHVYSAKFPAGHQRVNATAAYLWELGDKGQKRQGRGEKMWPHLGGMGASRAVAAENERRAFGGRWAAARREGKWFRAVPFGPGSQRLSRADREWRHCGG